MNSNQSTPASAVAALQQEIRTRTEVIRTLADLREQLDADRICGAWLSAENNLSASIRRIGEGMWRILVFDHALCYKRLVQDGIIALRRHRLWLGADDDNRVIYDAATETLTIGCYGRFVAGGQHPPPGRRRNRCRRTFQRTGRIMEPSFRYFRAAPASRGGPSADAARSHTFLNPTAMEWKDKIARLFRRKPDWKKEHRRTLIARHAENLLRERDIRSMTDLVRRHRKSDLTIAGIGLTMNTATSRFLRTPEDAAGKDMLELMDALRRTSFAKKIGRRLADVPADTAHSLHGLLAMHTFLLDAYLEQHPDSKLQQPPMDEVQAAAHIVDRQFRAETFRELRHLAETRGRYMPSCYVVRLYDWDADMGRLQKMRGRLDGPACPEAPQQVSAAPGANLEGREPHGAGSRRGCWRAIRKFPCGKPTSRNSMPSCRP